MHSEEVDKKDFIEKNREVTAKLISCGEEFIRIYREFINKNITEDELVEMVSPLNSKITNLYFEQGDLPVAPNELREWVNAQTKIASSIQDFSLYYDKNKIQQTSPACQIKKINPSIHSITITFPIKLLLNFYQIPVKLPSERPDVEQI